MGKAKQKEQLCDNCPLIEKVDLLRKIQYEIHHQLLFGPLARILGLIDLIYIAYKAKSYKEIGSLVHYLTLATNELKKGVRQIIENNGMTTKKSKLKVKREIDNILFKTNKTVFPALFDVLNTKGYPAAFDLVFNRIMEAENDLDVIDGFIAIQNEITGEELGL